MPNPQYRIRPATADDVPLVLSFILGLAEYEKLLDQVVATEDSLRESLFGESPSAEVIFLEYRNEAVGFALYFQNYSTFLSQTGIYLEDLFVLPEYRGRGFGKALLQHLAKIAVGRGCGRLEWAVLDWNTPAIEFYQSIGAKQMDSWRINRLSGPELKELADF